jgi:hypothetical protein
VYDACDKHAVPTVPLLYTGPFSLEGVERLTYGPTTFPNIKCSFKGREGVVVTPLQEQYSKQLRGRMIVKSVSADYRDRKNATDIE